MDEQPVLPNDPSASQDASFRDSGRFSLFKGRRLNAYISLTDILEPEFLLPVQYDDLVRRHVTRDGERRLLLAVLKDALRCYLKNMNGPTAHAYRIFEETAHWFYAKHQVGIFAYEHLCDALGIDPEPLREWLKTLHHGGNGAERDPNHGARNGRRAREFMKTRMVLA
jgi:hypothetical protein